MSNNYSGLPVTYLAIQRNGVTVHDVAPCYQPGQGPFPSKRGGTFTCLDKPYVEVEDKPQDDGFTRFASLTGAQRKSRAEGKPKKRVPITAQRHDADAGEFVGEHAQRFGALDAPVTNYEAIRALEPLAVAKLRTFAAMKPPVTALATRTIWDDTAIDIMRGFNLDDDVTIRIVRDVFSHLDEEWVRATWALKREAGICPGDVERRSYEESERQRKARNMETARQERARKAEANAPTTLRACDFGPEFLFQETNAATEPVLTGDPKYAGEARSLAIANGFLRFPDGRRLYLLRRPAWLCAVAIPEVALSYGRVLPEDEVIEGFVRKDKLALRPLAMSQSLVSYVESLRAKTIKRGFLAASEIATGADRDARLQLFVALVKRYASEIAWPSSVDAYKTLQYLADAGHRGLCLDAPTVYDTIVATVRDPKARVLVAPSFDAQVEDACAKSTAGECPLVDVGELVPEKLNASAASGGNLWRGVLAGAVDDKSEVTHEEAKSAIVAAGIGPEVWSHASSRRLNEEMEALGFIKTIGPSQHRAFVKRDEAATPNGENVEMWTDE